MFVVIWREVQPEVITVWSVWLQALTRARHCEPEHVHNQIALASATSTQTSLVTEDTPRSVSSCCTSAGGQRQNYEQKKKNKAGTSARSSSFSLPARVFLFNHNDASEPKQLTFRLCKISDRIPFWNILAAKIDHVYVYIQVFYNITRWSH